MGLYEYLGLCVYMGLGGGVIENGWDPSRAYDLI